MPSLYRFPQPTNNSKMRDMMILKDTFKRKKISNLRHKNLKKKKKKKKKKIEKDFR